MPTLSEIYEQRLDMFCAAVDFDPEIAALRAQRDDLLAAAKDRKLNRHEVMRLSDVMSEAVVRTAEICATLVVARLS